MKPFRNWCPFPTTDLILVAVLGVFTGACSFFEDEPPNIILISVDTLRHDHLGYTGYEPEGKSPSEFIDRLAKESAVFTHAVSTSTWTLPGHYALFTGLPDALHEMYDDLMPYDRNIKTMAEYLKEQGYATGGFYSGPYLHNFFGFHRGFDMYESCMKEVTLYDALAFKGKELSPEETRNLVLEKEAKSHLDVTSKLIVEKARYFVKSRKRDRFFLFLHFFDVHNDYIPPAPFNKKYNSDYQGWVNGLGVVRDPRINPDIAAEDLQRLKALYNGEISWVDHNLKWFFEEIEEISPGILDRTIVLFLSDHGEEFFEHGKIGHRGNLYGPTLRIPLFVRAPNLVSENKRIDEPVRIYDIYPTLLELAGLPLPDGIYGKSLVPLIQGGPFKPEPLMSELTLKPAGEDEGKDLYHKYFAFQSGNMKLIGFQKRSWSKANPIDFTGDLLEERIELFDVARDPAEKVNLADDNPKATEQLLSGYHQELERMRALYVKIHGSADGQGGRKEATELPDQIREDLERVGYLK